MKSESCFYSVCLLSLFCLFAFAGCQGSGQSASGEKNNQGPDAENGGQSGKTKIRLNLDGLPETEKDREFNTRLKFEEIQGAAGIDFTYQNGQQGQSLMVETTGGGSAWLDYDLDGRWDVVFCQGGNATEIATPSQPLDILYRQLEDGRFLDQTGEVRLEERGYSQGVSAGDFDGDGFLDIYVTNCGKNTFWKNMGDGSFVEIGEVAGIDNGKRWSSTSAWGDIDLDGDLDLYVCNYVQYDRFDPHPCQDEQGNPAICHPKHVDAWPDALYINQGDGTFRDESRKRGVYGPGNKGLGVAIADFNKDGFPDIYVANDTTANFLFVNDGKAHFEEVAGGLGCDVDRVGSFQASMGVGIFDYDENGFLDIFLTHYEEESNTLYQNRGEVGFSDVSARVRLFTPTKPWLGFGTIMADFNNDSLADIFVAQGHVNNTPLYKGKQKMVAGLYAFDGTIFHELTGSAGEYFSRKFIGRGTSCCDFDQDGDWDLMVNHQNDQASLLRNDSPSGHFIKLSLIGTQSNRMGIGTCVTVKSGDRVLYHELVGGTSYVSSNEPALIFGLGERGQPCEVQIRWPSGRVETMTDVAVDQSLVLVEK